PPLDSDPSKNKRHDYDASGSTQPPAPQSSAWKTSDTREAPSSSFRQKSAPHSEQPVEQSRLRRPSFQDSPTISQQQHLSSVSDGRVSFVAYRSS
ncbi:hypothetical protein Tco_0507319, partial [Tanacetum coccineum]